METQTQKAERKHPDKKPRVLHFTTRLSTCQPKIYNIDRRARRQDATETMWLGFDYDSAVHLSLPPTGFPYRAIRTWPEIASCAPLDL